jgi:hypothetical protein
VLLNQLETTAIGLGWVVISEIVRPGLVQELTYSVLPALLAAHEKQAAKGAVTGVNASVLGFGAGLARQVAPKRPVEPALGSEFQQLARVLTEESSGLFVSLDEVHRDEVEELKPLFHAIQQCFRQGLQVAFAAAGLPYSISGLLNENVLTYLRRAERFTLGALTPGQVKAAIQEPIQQNGRSIALDALDLAADAVQGYPFLVQVVGFELWQADPDSSWIDAHQAGLALEHAKQTAYRLVVEPALADLAGGDRDFLRAMAIDTSCVTQVSVLPERLRRSRGHVNKYRSRLIANQLIEPAGRGELRFAMPLLQQYLLEQGAADF